MSCKGYIVWMEPCRNNWSTKREKGREGFFLIGSFVMICHYTTLKTMWLPDFFCCASNYLYAILPRFLQSRRATPLTKTVLCTRHILLYLKCQRCYFPLVFLFLFFFVSSRIKVQIHDDNRGRNDHVWSLRYHIRGTSTVRI